MAEKVTKVNAKKLEIGRYKLNRALVELTCSHVFWASIVMRLRRSEDLTCPFPMGTDGRRLLVNPLQLAALSVEEVQWILGHEAGHVAGLHPFRQMHRREQLIALTPSGEYVPVDIWNIAADEVVNSLLAETSLKAPAHVIPAVADSTPEKQYEIWLKKAKKLPPPPPGAGSCGTGERYGRPTAYDQMLQPKNDQGANMSQAELQEATQEAKQWVAAAVNAAKRAGQMSAGLERFAERTLRSVVHWREVLARFVADKCLTDYSWQRPNRRYTAFNMYLPQLEAKDIPRVAIACDTSGSISPKMIEEVVAEVIAVLEMMSEGASVEVPVLWFDHAVYPQIVQDADELKVRGGGGTAYAPVMKWVTNNMTKHDFKGLIVVTDGYCGEFGEAPPCDVLWVLTQEHDKTFSPPFGEIALVLEEHR